RRAAAADAEGIRAVHAGLRREDRSGVQAEALDRGKLAPPRRGALLLERGIFQPAAETDSARRRRERAAQTGGAAGDRTPRRHRPLPADGPGLLSSGRYSLQDGPHEHGSFAGSSSPIPGPPDRGVRGFPAPEYEDPGLHAEVHSQGADAREAAGNRAPSEEDRFRHSGARMVPRGAASIADGYADSASHRIHEDLQRARNSISDQRSHGEAHQRRFSVVGPADAFPVDEEMEGRGGSAPGSASTGAGSSARDPMMQQEENHGRNRLRKSAETAA